MAGSGRPRACSVVDPPSQVERETLSWALERCHARLARTTEQEPEKLDLRYVLGLLLVRRRVVRFKEVETDEAGHEVSMLYCPRRETTYRVVTVMPDAQRTKEIQDELARLLTAQ